MTTNVLEDAPVCQKNDETFPTLSEEEADSFAVSVPFVVLLAEIHRLTDLVEEKDARIKELEERLRQDSHNSHKPPSTDGYRKPAPKNRSLRTQSGKKSGGQAGHDGTTLRQTETPDFIEIHAPETCTCGTDLSQAPVHGEEIRQVFELPEPRLDVTEHRIVEKICPSCRKKVAGVPPKNVTAPVQYGERFLSFLAYANVDQAIPLARVRRFAQDLFGASVSCGTVRSASKKLRGHLSGFLEALRSHLKKAPVMGADESGIRVEGKLMWLHVHSTPSATLYGVHEKRGKEGSDSLGVLPEFKGILVHDCWKTYFTYDNIKSHQLCCIHLIRELVAATENDGMRWSEEMGDFLSRAIGNPARPLPTAEQESLSKEYDTVISRGQAELGPDPEPAPGKKRVKRGKSQNLFGRLKSFKEFVLTFTKVPDVPPTNNESEQDVRKGKIQQNVSHCFRTKEGASLYFDIMSYIVTLRKNDVNIFSGIVSAMKGKPVIPFSRDD